MSTSKKWIIVAVILLGAGVLISGIAFSFMDFDFTRLGTVQYVSNSYDISEEFQHITINADTEDITFISSDDGSCRVVCLEDENTPHNVGVKNDTLTIDKPSKNNLQWSFGINVEDPSITVYLPGNSYGKLSVSSDTGDVDIPNSFSFDNIDISLDTGDASCSASANNDIIIKTDTGHITVSDVNSAGMKLVSDTGRMELSNVELAGDIDLREQTGKVTIEKMTCTNLTSNGDTGNLIITNVIASGTFNLTTETGNIELNGCDAGTIYAKTDTGNVTGSLLSDKVYIIETDTGNVDVPKTITGGRCEVTSDTGNIKFEVRQ